MTTSVDIRRSDFDIANQSGFADILWRDQAGDNVLWLNEPPGTLHVAASLPFVPPDWHVKATADFDGVVGGVEADILWENNNGALALWTMSGATVKSILALPNPEPTWHLVGDNFFKFDLGGSDQILWQNDNGSLAIWTFTSAATPTISGIFAGTQNPGPTWHVVGTGDTDGDSRAGILWQNDNGALALWEHGTFVTDSTPPPPDDGTFTFDTVAALPTVDPSWHVKGMADVSGDLRADIVFQNDNGSVAVWEMGDDPFLPPPRHPGGVHIISASLIDINPGPAWHIVSLRYIGGSGNADNGGADILFQNDNGATAVWEDYINLGGGSATFDTVLPITPNPNPNGHVWDLL